jgi:Leucine-rich repeat (LRR) protein
VIIFSIFLCFVWSDDILCSTSDRREFFNGNGFTCNFEKNVTITKEGLKLSNEKDENVTELIGENIETIEFLVDDISDIFPNLELVRVINTSLKAVNKRNLHSLHRVTYVYLEENSIASIDENTFDDMANLISLKLEDNKLTSIPTKLFSKLSMIEFIYLDNNQLTSLDPEMFKNNSKLVFLSMKENQLTTFDEKLFENLANLRLFRADSNQISTLPPELFKKCFSLENIYLSENKIVEIPAGLFSSLTFLEEVTLANNSMTFIDFGVFKDNKRLNLISFDKIEVKTILNIDDIDDLYQLKTILFTSSGDSCVKGAYSLTEKEKLKQYVIENCATKL